MKINEHLFTKEDFNELLKELGKECQKLFKHSQTVEIIIVGGASIVFNYNFRNGSADIDSMYYGITNETMKELITKIADKHNISTDWLNNDFKNTISYSPKIEQFSDYFKSYANGSLVVRTIKDEYLIAMKLQSNRNYKHDLSDILGILLENKNITLEKIDKAILDLYETNLNIDNDKYNFVSKCLENNFDLNEIRNKVIDKEKDNSEIAIKDNSDKNTEKIILEDLIEVDVTEDEYIESDDDSTE